MGCCGFFGSSELPIPPRCYVCFELPVEIKIFNKFRKCKISTQDIINRYIIQEGEGQIFNFVRKTASGDYIIVEHAREIPRCSKTTEATLFFSLFYNISPEKMLESITNKTTWPTLYSQKNCVYEPVMRAPHPRPIPLPRLSAPTSVIGCTELASITPPRIPSSLTLFSDRYADCEAGRASTPPLPGSIPSTPPPHR